jgi:uncharacterized protein (DUF302 family)
MEQIIKVSHQRVLMEKSYREFTENMESVLKTLPPDYAENIFKDPDSVKKHLAELAGDNGLIIFGIHQHGYMLNIVGMPKNARQYVIGNPLIAIQMTVHDIRAALYAPLRIIVYEADDKTVYVEYDLPSTLFGQFGNPEVLSVAKGLDDKLLRVINRAAVKRQVRFPKLYLFT